MPRVYGLARPGAGRFTEMKRLVSSMLMLAALVAAGPSRVVAADLRNVLAEDSLTSWTQKDGLTSTVIWSLAQDAVGYLWMGTDAGLLRFDGVRFVSWESFATVPPTRAAVRSLCAAHDGTLWFGFGEPGGVGSLHDGEVRTYGSKEGLPEGLVMMLAEDAAGTIWAGGRFGLYRLSGDRWEKADSGLPPGIVYSLFSDTDGSTLAATASGVFRRPPAQIAFERFDDVVDLSRSIARDREGRLWVTDPIVGYRQLQERRAPTHAVEKGRGLRLMYDSRGNLWVGTGGQGLWRVQRSAANASEMFEKASTVTGFSDDGVTAMLEDREGNIWAATLDGLNRLTPHKMSPITNLGLGQRRRRHARRPGVGGHRRRGRAVSRRQHHLAPGLHPDRPPAADRDARRRAGDVVGGNGGGTAAGGRRAGVNRPDGRRTRQTDRRHYVRRPGRSVAARYRARPAALEPRAGVGRHRCRTSSSDPDSRPVIPIAKAGPGLPSTTSAWC